MILGRLFAKLFELGTVVVATSNVAPDDLYKGGLNRALFLPFIAQITDHMDVMRLDARTDFRLEKLAGAKMWLVPADSEANLALNKAWAKMTGARRASRATSPSRAASCMCLLGPWRGALFVCRYLREAARRATICGSRMTITPF